VGNTQVQDLDGDGTFEDINGDGNFNLNDVIGFLNNYQGTTIQNNGALFNFNGDANNNVDLNDVIALLGMA
jgi:hypothetical protein